MWAGKSGVLINRMLRANIAGKTTAMFKPAFDDRYSSTEVVSHDGFRVSAIVVTTGQELLERWAELDRPRVVGVDEVQFFGLDVLDVLTGLSNRGVRVIVSGLSMDFLDRTFPVTAELLARADRVDKLVSVCHTCLEENATCSQLLQEGVPVTNAESTRIVGGEGLYEARCRSCFNYEGKPDAKPERRTQRG